MTLPFPLTTPDGLWGYARTTTADYLAFICKQLADVGAVRCRKMLSKYVGRDDRALMQSALAI